MKDFKKDFMKDFEQLSAGESYAIGRRTRPGQPYSEDLAGVMMPVEGTPGVFVFRYDFVQVWMPLGADSVSPEYIISPEDITLIRSDLKPGDRFATFPEDDDLGLYEKDVYYVKRVVVDKDHFEATLVPWTDSAALRTASDSLAP